MKASPAPASAVFVSLRRAIAQICCFPFLAPDHQEKAYRVGWVLLLETPGLCFLSGRAFPHMPGGSPCRWPACAGGPSASTRVGAGWVLAQNTRDPPAAFVCLMGWALHTHQLTERPRPISQRNRVSEALITFPGLRARLSHPGVTDECLIPLLWLPSLLRGPGGSSPIRHGWGPCFSSERASAVSFLSGSHHEKPGARNPGQCFLGWARRVGGGWEGGLEGSPDIPG